MYMILRIFLGFMEIHNRAADNQLTYDSNRSKNLIGDSVCYGNYLLEVNHNLSCDT
jgi:hypothetical protein